jgi:hypothetical protein
LAKREYHVTIDKWAPAVWAFMLEDRVQRFIIENKSVVPPIVPPIVGGTPFKFLPTYSKSSLGVAVWLPIHNVGAKNFAQQDICMWTYHTR